MLDLSEIYHWFMKCTFPSSAQVIQLRLSRAKQKGVSDFVYGTIIRSSLTEKKTFRCSLLSKLLPGELMLPEVMLPKIRDGHAFG